MRAAAVEGRDWVSFVSVGGVGVGVGVVVDAGSGIDEEDDEEDLDLDRGEEDDFFFLDDFFSALSASNLRAVTSSFSRHRSRSHPGSLPSSNALVKG